MKPANNKRFECAQSIVGYLILAVIMIAMGNYAIENKGIRFKRFLEHTNK